MDNKIYAFSSALTIVRDILAWVQGQPDFADPDVDAPELTPKTVNAVGKYLEEIADGDEWLESLAYEWRNCTSL